jgi:hypothetical protein
MIIVICGIITGILFSYLVIKRTNEERVDYYALATTPQSRATSIIGSLWGAVIFIEIIIVAAVIGVVFDSYVTSTGAITPPHWMLFAKEVVESFMVPFIAGAAIGATFFRLYTTGTLSGAPIATVSALMFAVIIVFFAATEQQYGWFSRIQKFSLASAELDFSPTKETPVAPAQIHSSDQNAAVGPSAVDVAIDFIPKIAKTIVRDRDYLVGVTKESNDFASETEPDFRFMVEIVLPLVNHLQAIHSRRADTDISDYFDRKTVMAVRSLVNLDHPDSDVVGQVEAGVKRAWAEACKEKYWSSHALGNDESNTKADFYCQNGIVDPSIKDTVESYFKAWKFSGKPLNPARPYGAILSAWLLVAAGEPEAALRDLDSWRRTNVNALKNETDADGVIRYQVYDFEILNTISSLYINMGTNRNTELESLSYFNSAIKSGQALIMHYGGEKLAAMKKLSENSESGIKIECSDLVDDWFKPVYLGYLISINNLVDVLGKYPDMIVALGAEQEIRRYANELLSIDLQCLYTQDKYQKGFKKYSSYPIDNKVLAYATPPAIDKESTDDTLEAFYDSRATAFRGLASALGTSDLMVWEKAMCESLRSAIDGRKLVKQPPSFELLMDELAKVEIPKQRGHIDGLEQITDLDELAKDDKNLLAQAGRDPSCSLE